MGENQSLLPNAGEWGGGNGFTIDQGYIDVQLGVFLVLRGWLGCVIRSLISGKYTCEIL